MSSLIRNLFFGTNIYGKFKVYDNPLGLENADVYFQRDLVVDGTTTMNNTSVKANLSLGTETTSTDSSGNTTYTNSGGTITVKLKDITHTLTPTMIANLSRNMFGNSINTKTLTIRVGVNANNLAVNQVTFDTGATGDTYQFNGSLSTTNGCTLGDGNDLSRVRRNLNIDNCLRVGYNDTTNVNAGNSNDSKLDVSGNVFITGTIYNNDLANKLLAKADVSYVDSKFNSLLGGTLDTTLDTLAEITQFFQNSDNTITTNLTSLISGKISGTEADTKISNALTTYYTKTETDTKLSSIVIPSLTGYATESYISTNYYPKSSVYTKTETDGKYALITSIPSLTGYATELYVSDGYYPKTSVYTKTESDGKYALITSIPSLTGYATELYVSDGYYPKTSVYTKTEADGKYALITSIPSLSGYATQTYVTNTSYTKTYIDTNYYTKTNTYTKTEVDGKIPSLVNYVKVSDTPTWTGIHTYNSYPQISVYSAPTLRTQFSPKGYVDDQIATRPTTTNITNTAFNWTKQHTFNSFIPTTTLTPSLNTHFITKLYADTAINVKANSSNPRFTGTVAISDKLSFTNVTLNNRIIQGLGNLFLCDQTDNTNDYAMQIGHSGVESYFVNHKNSSHFSFSGRNYGDTDTTYNKLYIVPSALTGQYNGTTVDDDVLVFANSEGGISTQSMNITVQSQTKTGCRIEPTRTTLSGGNNSIVVDSSAGITVSGTVSGITKGMVGLDQVDNISDANKPISNATQTALNSINSNIEGLSYDSTTVKSTFNNDLAVNGIVNASSGLKVNNGFTVYPNTILDESYPKTLGFTNIASGYVSLEGMNKKANITIPISTYRKYRNNVSTTTTMVFTETLNSITYTVYKNGIAFSSGTCSYNNTLPKTIQMRKITSSTTSYEYEVYLTNAQFSFVPTMDEKGAIYSFFLTINSSNTVSPTNNVVNESYGYYVNTDTLFTEQPYSGTVGTDYTIPLSDFSDEVLPSYSTQSVCYTNTVNASKLVAQEGYIDNLFITTLFSPSTTGLYMFTSTQFIYSTPIPFFCSVRTLQASTYANNFVWYVVFPGFQVEFYNSDNQYVNRINPLTISNTSSEAYCDYFPSTGTTVYRNNVEGIRLYKYVNLAWTEIIIPNISN